MEGCMTKAKGKTAIRAAILEAAKKLFAAKGFGAAARSTGTICRMRRYVPSSISVGRAKGPLRPNFDRASFMVAFSRLRSSASPRSELALPVQFSSTSPDPRPIASLFRGGIFAARRFTRKALILCQISVSRAQDPKDSKHGFWYNTAIS